MISFVLASILATAQPAPSEKTPVQMCVDTCIAMNEQPGYELRQCIAQCNAYSRLSTMPVEDDDMGPCETYEDGCERPSRPDLF